MGGTGCTFSSSLPTEALLLVALLPGWYARLLGWESIISGSTGEEAVAGCHTDSGPTHPGAGAAICSPVSLLCLLLSVEGLVKWLLRSRRQIWGFQSPLCLSFLHRLRIQSYGTGLAAGRYVLFPDTSAAGMQASDRGSQALWSARPSVCLSLSVWGQIRWAARWRGCPGGGAGAWGLTKMPSDELWEIQKAAE